LSPARIWATLATRSPHSKESGALWALPRLAPADRPLVEHALVIYRGERDWHDFDPRAVRAYVDDVAARPPVSAIVAS
jgi:Domain of unknown function (DUF4111)